MRILVKIEKLHTLTCCQTSTTIIFDTAVVDSQRISAYEPATFAVPAQGMKVARVLKHWAVAATACPAK
jgi:hypothetical protein